MKPGEFPYTPLEIIPGGRHRGERNVRSARLRGNWHDQASHRSPAGRGFARPRRRRTRGSGYRFASMNVATSVSSPSVIEWAVS
jgi:hypothetical protein